MLVQVAHATAAAAVALGLEEDARSLLKFAHETGATAAGPVANTNSQPVTRSKHATGSRRRSAQQQQQLLLRLERIAGIAPHAAASLAGIRMLFFTSPTPQREREIERETAR